MRFDHFPSLRHIFFLILQEVGAFGYEIINGIPECVVERQNFLGYEIICSAFDSNSNASELLPVNTTKLDISRSSLPTNVPLAPRLKMLISLKLPDNNMHDISNIMFEGLSNLKNISLNRNNLSSLPESTFCNTPNLEVLDLSNNNLISLKDVMPALRNLRNFSYLDLSKNKRLTTIEDEDFVPLENVSLGVLDISNCSFKIIEENAFKPLKLLYYLDISSNPLSREGLVNLSSLHTETLKFLRMAKLEALSVFLCKFMEWLERTRIQFLEIENKFYCTSFGNLPFLQAFIIRSEISVLLDQHLKGIPNLEYLVIQEHRIQSIHKQFASSIHLRYLDLSFFRGRQEPVFMKIEDFAFENLSHLRVLYLKSLPIKKIQRYMLHGLRNLEEISFHDSDVLTVECYAFETLNNLITLDLSFNIIDQLFNCTFYGLKNVEEINLSGNHITSLTGTYPFDYMINLKYLFLNRNKIIYLPPGIFKKLTNIYLITLTRNRIIPWVKEILPETLNNASLHISNNGISYFTNQMFRDVFKLIEIDFAFNPINCSECSTLQLQDWMRNTTTKILHKRTYGNYICYHPIKLGPNPIIDTNLTSFTYHCIIAETDINKILYAVFSPILCIGVISLAVWYFCKWNIKLFIFELQLNIRKYKEYKDNKHYNFDAFVSYCENDLQWIRNYLVPALQKCDSGIQLCLPDRHFNPGLSILENVISAIDQSRTTIIVLSNEYLKCSWCLYNIQMAHNMLFEKTRSGLIVILLEEIQKSNLTKDLEYVFRTRTCIWWTKNPVGQKLFWKRLHLAVTKPMDKGISVHIT